jgi:hypothetical protein
MNRFTLLHKVGIQLFYKVVNIIQEYSYTTTNILYHAKSPQKSKMIQRYTKVNLIN